MKHKTLGKIQENPFDEARRYIQNAKNILKEKAVKEGDFYNDKKYVRMAGNTAWNGCLIALEATLKVKKTLKKANRPDIQNYKDAASKIDRNANDKIVMTAYNHLHLIMGYDGELSYKTVQEGLKRGENLIEWCEKHYKP
ncbi:MAG: hypothetical protein OHK0038_28890 [Flammeovirgaceae bacterium]